VNEKRRWAGVALGGTGLWPASVSVALPTPFRYLFILLLVCAAHARGQPLLSQMEEGDKIQLRIWITGCFQIEDNAYEFEMKEGKTLCTGWILPDYVTPQRYPRVPAGPVELSRDQIAGIDLDIVGFRTTQIRSHRKASTGVTLISRNSGAQSTTTSEIKLTFIEKGKTLIEETITCPDLSEYNHARHPGLDDLKRRLQLKVKPQLDDIMKKLKTESPPQSPAPETPSSNSP